MGGLAIALAVVLAGKPAGGAPKECEVHGPAFGLDRLLRCANVTIEIFPPIPSALEQAALADHARSAASASSDREILSAEAVVVGGKKRPGFRFVRRRPDAVDSGVVVALPAGKGLSRIVLCSRAFESYCRDVLELTLRGLPAPTAVPPSGAPVIAGRALTVPAGCRRREPTALGCGATELVWAHLLPRAPQTLDEVDPMVRRAHLHLGKVEVSDSYCEVEKVDALCRVATITGKDGSARRFAFAFAEVRGAKLFVSCATSEGLGESFPAPCAQVMAFKPASSGSAPGP